jgi:putative FmdB family regulatory protein
MPIYSYKCEYDHVTDHLGPMSNRNDTKVCKVCRADAYMIITPVKVSLDPTDPAFAGTWMTWERNRAKQMKQEIRLEKKREG